MLAQEMTASGIAYDGAASWADCLAACRDQLGCQQIVWANDVRPILHYTPITLLLLPGLPAYERQAGYC